MGYSICFIRRRTLILKALILTVIWFMIALLTAPPPTENDDAEEKPLKMVKPTYTKKKNRTYGNNLFDAPTRVDWLGRIAGKEAAPGTDDAPGELGKPVILPKNIPEEIKQVISQGWKKNAFNQFVSDIISIRRKLPDPRDKWCKVPGRYLENLPQTSVVICFHNEAWSALLRTVHSVLDRSPDHLIKEVILVDDFSDMPHLMQQLDDYMSLLPKVRIVRASRREGLIRARLLGARYVTAPVLTYLDSHCECNEGWLEPLLDRIARSKTTVVCPVIDVIDPKTFQHFHSPSSSTFVGGFNWNLEFDWHPVPSKERARHQHPAEPLWSPTMAGGLFAIDKDFFERLGTYDSGFDIWGGENLELSFKTWMCGGTLEIVPCSHVGHIFRDRTPYKWRTDIDVLKKNSVRLAEVWLDDYAKYYYQRTGADTGDYSDVSDRRELRKKLGCKSFEWYVKNIYPELFIPDESIAHGEFWLYSKYGEIRRDDTCLDYSKNDVVLYRCHAQRGNQLWLYNERTKLLKHDASEKCMAISRNKDKIVMEMCNESEARQIWILENYNPERLTPDLTRVD